MQCDYTVQITLIHSTSPRRGSMSEYLPRTARCVILRAKSVTGESTVKCSAEESTLPREVFGFICKSEQDSPLLQFFPLQPGFLVTGLSSPWISCSSIFSSPKNKCRNSAKTPNRWKMSNCIRSISCLCWWSKQELLANASWSHWAPDFKNNYDNWHHSWPKSKLQGVIY